MMMLDLKDPEIFFALGSVQQASWLVRWIQHDMVAPALAKEDRSPVTLADFASQALVGCRLEQAFAGDGLVGEEDSQTLREPQSQPLLASITRYLGRIIPQASPQAVCAWIDRGAGLPAGRYWVLDPIDGTKGFLRGGQYAVALALIEDNQVQLGVLGCPNLGLDGSSNSTGALFIAARGSGAWQAALPGVPQADVHSLHFSRLQVSAQSDPTLARLLRSFEASHTDLQQLDRLAHRLRVQPTPLRLDSQVKYGLLAAGTGDVIVKPLPASNPGYREKIWDHAAGALLVEEAGGCVTDLDGRPLDWSAGRMLTRNQGVLTTNGSLHAVFLKAINEIRL